MYLGRSVLDDRQSSKHGFWGAVLHLIGHIIGGAVLFISVACVTWGLGFALAKMNELHPFPGPVLSLLHNFEIGLLLADALLSAIVVLYGIWQFLRQLGGRDHE